MKQRPKEIEIISKKINEVLKKYNINPSDLDCNGAIYYANGNDGTDFDWECNDRLCEFMVYHKNEMGCVKVLVDKDNTMDIYVYPNGEMKPKENIVCDCGFSARHLKDTMMSVADNQGKWDRTIEDLFE